MKINISNKQTLRFAITLGIVLLLAAGCCAAIFAQSNAVFAVDDTSKGTVEIDELLLKSTYDTSKADAPVFSGKRFEDLINALRSDAERQTPINALSDKNAAALRTINGGKDIVVTIDDMQWTVTDLRKLSDGRVIATMWLMSSSDTSRWNAWSSNTPSAKYPSNMYSSSYIRASALNSGGCGYVATNGATSLTTLAQDATHRYAKFTMNSVVDGTRNLSLTDFIVRPKDVEYQRTESIRTFLNGWSTQPNDAWGTPLLPSYASSAMNYSSKSYYDQWSTDCLWLPSLPEAGYNGSLAGHWGLSTQQRGNATGTWLRSGAYDIADKVLYLNASGGYSTAFAGDDYAVRPAFHLDLTAANNATDAIRVPSVADADKTKEYNGETQTIALQNFDSDKMSAVLSGVDPSGNPIAESDVAFDAETGEMQVKWAGTYTVEIAFSEPSVGVWADVIGGNGKRSVTFTIAPKELTLDLINNVPSQLWEWSVGGDYDATLTASGIVSGDTVGLTATYTDQASGASKSVAAELSDTQAVATIRLSEIAVGSYKLTAALDKSAADNDNINYSIAKGMETVGLPKSFTVLSKKIDTSKIAWQYTELGPSGNPITGGANQADIASGKQIAYRLFGTLDSHGAVTNKLEIKRSTLPKDDAGNLLVEIDNLTSSFNGTTYTDGYSNQSGSAVAHYTTKVLLKIVNDDYLFDNNKKQIELSIDWEIVKGKFDVSGVKWKYKYTTPTGTVSNFYDPKTTKLEYNDGSVIKVEIDPTTLPLGLSAPGGIFDYQNASGIEVKTYAATVAGDTLDYDDACFEQPADLVLNWEILGKGIAVKWKPVQSGTYYLKELNCDPKYTIGDSKIVHYKYFAPDGSLLGIDEAGRQAIADKVIADNIGPENPQTFTIEAYLDGNNSGNYRLLADPARTTVSIGNDPYTAVEAQVPETATYDGNAHYTQDEVKISGAPVGANGYTITYYAGTDVTDMSKNTKLDGAPKDAGKYVIAIEMTDESYLLDKSVFAVEILPKQVAVPTVKAVSFTGAEYDLLDLMSGYDAALMTMDLVTTATAAGTYRAMLTLNSANYVWATADGATGSQEYALEWSIAKAQLTEIWNKDGDGKPTLSISSKYADYVQIVYEYCDADGNVVAESDLVAGQTYKVVAKLSAASAENFEFVDVNGDVSTTPSQSGTQTFTFGNDAANPDAPGNNGNATLGGVSEPWFKIVMIAMLGVMVMIMLLLFMIWIAVIGIRNLRKDRKRGA